MSNPLHHVTTAALKDKRHAAERIAEQVATKTGGTNYRPTLLELDTERRNRAGLEPYRAPDEPLLPAGGQDELDAMSKRYRKQARKQGRK